MMGGMDGVMGTLMGLMMGYWLLVSLLVLVVLGLLAVWLFQQVRRGPSGTGVPAGRGYPPETRA